MRAPTTNSRSLRSRAGHWFAAAYSRLVGGNDSLCGTQLLFLGPRELKNSTKTLKANAWNASLKKQNKKQPGTGLVSYGSASIGTCLEARWPQCEPRGTGTLNSVVKDLKPDKSENFGQLIITSSCDWGQTGSSMFICPFVVLGGRDLVSENRIWSYC